MKRENRHASRRQRIEESSECSDRIRNSSVEEEEEEEESTARVSKRDRRGRSCDTPSKSARETLERVSRNFRDGQSSPDGTENDSPEVKRREKPSELEDRPRAAAGPREGLESDQEPAAGKRNRKHARRTARRKHGERFCATGEDRRKGEAGSRASSRRGDGDDAEVLRRSKSARDRNELPIAEILKKAQENARTTYEEPTPLPRLTADKIYIQRRDTFSAVKIAGSRSAGKRAARSDGRGRNDEDAATGGSTPPIRAAIAVQRLFGCTGLVYQGLLGGMALMHFALMQVFFDASTEFIADYSLLSEIYTNAFSFLIVLCVVSIFDKYDVARLGAEHAREFSSDRVRGALAIPVYAAIFCFHQASARTDDLLALTRHRSLNGTARHNASTLADAEPLLEELKTWQRVTVSKDLLAVLAWVLVSLGTKNDMFLTHLESMQVHAENDDSFH